MHCRALCIPIIMVTGCAGPPGVLCAARGTQLLVACVRSHEWRLHLLAEHSTPNFLCFAQDLPDAGRLCLRSLASHTSYAFTSTSPYLRAVDPTPPQEPLHGAIQWMVSTPLASCLCTGVHARSDPHIAGTQNIHTQSRLKSIVRGDEQAMRAWVLLR